MNILPPPSHQSILATLRNLDSFSYCANHGNLGDQLLATATRQFFKSHHIPFRIFTEDDLQKPCNLVYGGGGAFVPFWNTLGKYKKLLTHPNLQQCIILPHSFYQADELVTAFDHRHIIYCREQQSYNYCRGLNKKADFRLGDDMALSLNMNSLPATRHHLPLPLASKFIAKVITKTTGRSPHKLAMLRRWTRERRTWNNHFLAHLNNQVATHLIENTHGQKVGFFMRSDEEAIPHGSLHASLDLSLLWNSFADDPLLCDHLTSAFIDSVNKADIIVTDRLHVGIAAYLLDKEVYWLDNVYHKISEISRHSNLANAKTHLFSQWQDLPESIRTLGH